MRIIKFWRHIVSWDNILVTYIYNNMVETSNKGALNWTRNMKLLLDNYGFSYVWNNLHAVNLSSFHFVFKERIIDIFKQTSINALSQSSPLFIQRFQTWVGVLLDFSLTVKAATLIFISGFGSAISSAK